MRVFSEDRKVLDFMSTASFNSYLEAGAGKGRFIGQVLENWPNVSVTAVDINPKFGDNLAMMSAHAVTADIRYLPFNDNTFDVTQCSHVIEHFAYADACNVLDELLRVTAQGGYIIIRTPLMNPHFYDDMDHVRPYPPAAIMSYFQPDLQTQANSVYRVRVISIWLRYSRLRLRNYRSRQLQSTLTRDRIPCWVVGWLNKALNLAFNHFRFPRTSYPTGYTMILQKVQVPR